MEVEFETRFEPDKLFRDLPGGTGHLGREGGHPQGSRGSFEHRMRGESSCSGVASDVLRTCPSLAVIGVAELERFVMVELNAALSAGEVVDASLDDSLAFLLMCRVVPALVATAALLLIGPGMLGASIVRTERGATMLGADSQAGHNHLTASGYDEAPNHCCDSGLLTCNYRLSS